MSWKRREGEVDGEVAASANVLPSRCLQEIGKSEKKNLNILVEIDRRVWALKGQFRGSVMQVELMAWGQPYLPNNCCCHLAWPRELSTMSDPHFVTVRLKFTALWCKICDSSWVNTAAAAAAAEAFLWILQE
jgi:hypothetical protein